MEIIDVSPICTDASAAAIEYANNQRKNIAISINIPTDIPQIYVDKIALRRIIDNLLHNAVQAILNSGDIDINVVTTNKHLIIRVEDTGSGVPQVLRNRVFEPHISNRPGGSGLGLAIVAELTSAMRGTYGLENRADHQSGSAFWVSFPRVEETSVMTIADPVES